MGIKLVSLAALIFFISCTGYKPIVDMTSVQDKEKYQRDLAECESLAHQNTNTGTSAAGGAVLGGAIGAGLGALIAAIFKGNVGRGAAAGGVVGGSQGVAQGAIADRDKYQRIYANCMGGRGYNVLY